MYHTYCAPPLIPTSALGTGDRGASFTLRDLPAESGRLRFPQGDAADRDCDNAGHRTCLLWCGGGS